MRSPVNNILEGVKKYRLELRHVTVLFIVLIFFQLIISSMHKISLQNFLVKTQEWYQQESAEQLANLTTTTLELLLETKTHSRTINESDKRKIIQDFDIIFSQQVLHQNVEEVCILISDGDDVFAIDDGAVLYSYIFENLKRLPPAQQSHTKAIALYKTVKQKLVGTEQIQTVVEGKQTFHIFVPFVPRGEFFGAGYMRNTPDISFITKEMIANYDETAFTYLALIFGGLLAMFFISSYTLRERNEAQQLLFEEQTKHLTEQIHHQKEMLFTKRIYHTHHKAEKVMGFIKEDVRNISEYNIEMIKKRITRYANFIARVIYDMKWYDPPVQTIRNPIFNTNLNEVIRFIVDNIFLRVTTANEGTAFTLQFDEHIPTVHINEFVIWEVLEPIIQNSLDHASHDNVAITICTEYDPKRMVSFIKISDNGQGIEPWLLKKDEHGIKKIFTEHTSTKKVGTNQQSGYGCYIAYEIATQRCGWYLDVENNSESGCTFTFTIPHKGYFPGA